MEVIDFSERCGFCGRKQVDPKTLRDQLFGDKFYKACEICYEPIKAEDEKALDIIRKNIAEKKRALKRKQKARIKLEKKRRRNANPYTNKKHCNICKFWMNKNNWKKHNETRRHARNLIKQINNSHLHNT